MDDCGGAYTIFNGMKDCGDCLIPHEQYDYVVRKITEYNKNNVEKEVKNGNRIK